MDTYEINISEFVAFVQVMKPGQTGVYPHRFSPEQRRQIRNAYVMLDYDM